MTRQTDRIAALVTRVLTETRWPSVIVDVLALLAMAIFWNAPWAMTAAAIVIVAATLAALVWEDPPYWTGRFLTSHLILLAAAVAMFTDGWSVVGIVGVVLVGGAVATEGALVRSMPSLDMTPSANILPVAVPRPLAGPSRFFHILLSIATVVAVASAAFDLVWLAVVVAAIVLVVDGGYIASLVRRSMQRDASGKRARAKVRELGPVFYVHWDAPAEGHYQVTMWVPYLERLGVPFVIIVRSRKQLDALASRVAAPVLLCVTAEEIERSILPSVRAVLFVNTALRNAHYLRFNELRAIQLNHGDSDKPASASRQFRAYDRNLVAGQAAVDRFAHYGVEMPRELVRIVGRPQVEEVERPTQPRTGAPTVLYAPTWAGFFTDSNLSSLPSGVAMVEDLLERGCTIVFRPHAFTSRNADLQAQADRIRALLADDARRTGRAHLFGAVAESEMTVVDCFNASDAMVADVSSIVSDYLYSEKPFAMASAGMPRTEFTAAYPVSQAAYVVDPDRSSFHAAFDAMLGDDPLRAERVRLRRHYLGDFPAEGYSEVFVQALREELAAETTR
ncbi:CDP-glycerol glycerophosphotransferase family protein [Microbacterium mangrovi]|uniref:CDP-glycerol glycerophosphotransferase family protein n=1 Tax=Microbacterium mangrovi TaxID=1348253 RepID=UPI00068C2F7A|nr:CDP-glycerol glycerophosphotransferase family protein [Microbacterium mangrovi]